MKNLNIFLSFLIIAFAFPLIAQNVPQKFKYQGVAKLENQIIKGEIGLRISILEDSPEGEMVFQEQHNVETNGDGVFSTEVGNGDTIHGSMGAINWATGRYYMKVELDPDGGTEYVDMGWSQLVSVPFAMHAGTVDDRDDADADPLNELQDLGFDPLTNELTITEGNTVTLPPPGTDDQTLTLDDTKIEIENGNTIDLFELLSNVDDADSDPTNELQDWSNLPGIPEDILDGDNVIDADANPKNELQTLQWQINNTPWSDEWELQLVHEEPDPDSGMPVTIIDDSLIIPDSDPVNECQILAIMPDPDNPSNSKLEILKKDCIIDSSGNAQTVWIPFGEPAIIKDTDSTNELQNLSFDPNTNIVEISDGNKINLTDLRTPWEVSPSPSDDCISYEGKATSGSFETTEGAVVIDDSGISRYNPTTGENVSNICLEEELDKTWGKMEILFNAVLAAIFQSCIHGSGILDVFGPNGNYNVIIGHEDGLPNNGRIGVVNANNIEVAGYFVNNLGQGVSFADLKNFRMPHPKEASKEIWYASLEGPEAGAYERGTAQLHNGEVFVQFSDHFNEVINPEYMTVMLTPLSSNTLGLAVIEKSATGFKVKELMNGTGNFEFDWEVKSVRKSYENYEPVRKKRDNDFVHTRLKKDK